MREGGLLGLDSLIPFQVLDLQSKITSIYVLQRPIIPSRLAKLQS